ncbi:MAG: transposase [Deltaproteobacteria bacterium]
MTVQTFGDYPRWHPHFHALVADGLFTRHSTIHVIPKVDVQPLAEIFRARVLKMLQKEGLIDDRFVKMILGWRHVSGFSVHNGVRLRCDDQKGMESLAQYIIRSPFSIGKMQYVAESGKVVYRSKMTHGRNKRNFKIFDAEEFIAAITQYIPEKGFQLVRYYGWYSNRMRGDRLKEKFSSQEEKTTSDQDPVEIIDLSFLNRNRRKIPSPTWRECIKRYGK